MPTDMTPDAGASLYTDDGKVAITQVSDSPKVQPTHATASVLAEVYAPITPDAIPIPPSVVPVVEPVAEVI